LTHQDSLWTQEPQLPKRRNQPAQRALDGDVAIGRFEFVCALTRLTDVRRDLVERCAAMIEPDARYDMATRVDIARQTLPLWASRWHLECPWVLEWAERQAVDEIPRSDEENEDDYRFCELNGPPTEAVIGLVVDEHSPFFDWLPDEGPPLLFESSQEFLARMKRAYDWRQDLVDKAIGARRRRELAQHAQWTVRFQVRGDRLSDIAAGAGIDNRNRVPIAIDRFARLIELPLRATPSRSFKK
jgi:hypothetical protein